MAELNQEQLAAIGRVAVSFSSLHVIVSSLVWKLMGDQTSGRIITDRMTFARVAELARTLANEKTPKVVAELDKLLPKVQEAARLRNDVLHSVWSPHLRGTSDVPGTFYKVSVRVAGGRLKYEVVAHPDLNELQRVAEEIDTAASNFISFLIRHDLTGG